MKTWTYALAMAAGKDTADRQMKKSKRTVWNEDDYNLMCETVDRLLGSAFCCGNGEEHA